MVRRRDVLATITAGGIAGSALRWSTRTASALTRTATEGDRSVQHDQTRVQQVDADPESGFNVPYYLATPAEFRSGPVPVMVEMNDALRGQTVEDLHDPVRDQISQGRQGRWLCEELGIPLLIPVVPRPDDGPVYGYHVTTMLDREAMLLEGTDLDRLDRQLLRMAEHARQEVLTDRETQEQVVFYGNSSGGVVAERMAAMHPESVQAVVGGAVNGFVLLPYEELGGHELNYPIGVNDYESVVGKPYDPQAHATVDMFYFQGGADPKDRLYMDDSGDPDLFNDMELLRAARAAYGADMVNERFPRCHAAFQDAGIDAQFRVYEELTHNPEPVSEDLRDFLERSLEGEDVGEFGQDLQLDLDREPVELGSEPTTDGVDVEFDVAGDYPPLEGLVSYSWTFGDGSTEDGRPVTATFADLDTYEVTVAMETGHGQRKEQTIQYTVRAALPEIEAVDVSSESVAVGETVTVSVTVGNAGNEADQLLFAFAVDGEVTDRETLYLDGDESEQIAFEHTFEADGEYDITVNGESLGTVTVGSPSAQTDAAETTGDSEQPTEPDEDATTDTGSPGFGIPTALAAISSLGAYWRYRTDEPDE